MSGSALDLEEDLNTELDIVGRINPDTVWDYISKTKKTSNKDIVILRLQAANDEEKMQYIALYSYLSSRNRCVSFERNKIVLPLFPFICDEFLILFLRVCSCEARTIYPLLRQTRAFTLCHVYLFYFTLTGNIKARFKNIKKYI